MLHLLPHAFVRIARSPLPALGCVLLPSFAATFAAAQSQPAPEAAATANSREPQTLDQASFEPAQAGLGVSTSLSGAYVLPADIKTGGEVSRWLAIASVGIEAPVTDQLSLNAGLGAARLEYDFKNANILANRAKPWETINTYDANLGATFLFDDHWTFVASATVISAGEDGAEFEDTLTYGGAIGGIYTFDESLSIGLLLFAQTRLEDNTLFLPFPTVDWALPFGSEQRWRLNVGGSRNAGIAGGGIGISYRASDELSFSAGLGGIGVGGEYRLKKDGPVPGGVGRDNTGNIALGVDWQPTQSVTLSAFIGYALSGEIELLDAGGTRLAKRDVDPSLTFGASLSFAF